MNREDYGKKINYIGEAVRVMEFDSEQKFEVGKIYKLGIHWATPDATDEDFLEGKKFTYVFHCKQCEGYKLNYDNLTDEDKYELDTDEDAFGECEVLIDAEKQFKIISFNGGYVDDYETIYLAEIEVEIA